MIVRELKNVCPKYVCFDESDEILTQLKFDGGCDGCFEVLYKFLVGKKIKDIVKLLNVKCYINENSCLKQLGILLKKYKGNVK